MILIFPTAPEGNFFWGWVRCLMNGFEWSLFPRSISLCIQTGWCHHCARIYIRWQGQAKRKASECLDMFDSRPKYHRIPIPRSWSVQSLPRTWSIPLHSDIGPVFKPQKSSQTNFEVQVRERMYQDVSGCIRQLPRISVLNKGLRRINSFMHVNLEWF